jgi:hypothetical protein
VKKAAGIKELDIDTRVAAQSPVLGVHRELSECRFRGWPEPLVTIWEQARSMTRNVSLGLAASSSFAARSATPCHTADSCA